ncbi:hypothetical protein EDB84DRAFT_1675478 [Lactarius hengduanensis]|nr:hypothetical protein EDB84DRAFT_1675478 [Lactarius hengduanensis]
MGGIGKASRGNTEVIETPRQSMGANTINGNDNGKPLPNLTMVARGSESGCAAILTSRDMRDASGRCNGDRMSRDKDDTRRGDARPGYEGLGSLLQGKYGRRRSIGDGSRTMEVTGEGARGESTNFPVDLTTNNALEF